ncbi:hypothetical protein Taro_031410 [Colocasia esculenta]|uniref:Retrotransposon gag domain-containing protein n=1 Tax=Colocasia esculenta TaxID=4460 RepID=A0A843W0T8_COLES|nr:hypothetical protein [Colocasia esculenta]
MIKLVGQAQTYWLNVETLYEQRELTPIESWEDMKVKLREKYLPATYRHRLIDRWQELTQGTRTISEYIADFDEYLLRCGAREEGAITLSRFRKGLRRVYQHELFRQHVTTIEQAYQVVQVGYAAGDDLALEYQLDDELVDPAHAPSLEEVPSDTRLGVVRCILAQPKESADWRRTSIFQTYCRLGGRICRVIVDKESCINAISTRTVTRLGLVTENHPHPYHVSWVDSTTIPVQSRCLIPLRLHAYEAKIWCDVLPMEVGSIILGRPWIYDVDATLYGRTNTCVFDFGGQRITIYPSPPPAPTPTASSPSSPTPQVSSPLGASGVVDPSRPATPSTPSVARRVPTSGAPTTGSSLTPSPSILGVPPLTKLLQLITARAFEQELSGHDQEYHFSMLQRETEKLKTDIEKMRSELRYEIDKVTAGQRLDLNLERGRTRDELAKQSAETSELTNKLDREIHELRAQLEAAKYDIIKYCIGTLVSISAVGLAVIRILL